MGQIQHRPRRIPHRILTYVVKFRGLPLGSFLLHVQRDSIAVLVDVDLNSSSLSIKNRVSASMIGLQSFFFLLWKGVGKGL